MEVLLINPPGSTGKAIGALRHLMKPWIPSGLGYIGGVLEKNAINVKILDAFALNYGIGDILFKIKEYRPRIIGLPCLTVNAEVVTLICRHIRRLFPDIKIIIGNIHASLFDSMFLNGGLVDFVIHGEGEYITLDLVKEILGGGDGFERIRGTSFNRDGQIIRTPQRDFIENLDELPMMPYHLLPVKAYKTWIHWEMKSPAMTMLTSRGCPYQCVFCSIFSGKKVRARDPKNIAEEIEFLVKTYGIRQIQFTDAVFPFIKKIGIELCEEIIRRGLHKKIVWVSETRVSVMDKELATIMRHSGCRRVAFGIESGVPEVLVKIKKGINLKQVRLAVDACNDAGIDVIGLFMIGLPGDTAENIKKTVSFATRLNLYMAKFNMTVPYPGTEIYNRMYADKKEDIKEWENFQQYPSGEGKEIIFVPEGMNKEELFSLQRYAFSKFYLRPRAIFNIIRKIRLSSLKDYFWSAVYVLGMKFRR